MTVAGVILSSVGIGLRMRAAAIGTRLVSAASAFREAESWSAAMADITHANALNDIAMPVLWGGLSLLVLSATIFLLPVFQNRASPQNLDNLDLRREILP